MGNDLESWALSCSVLNVFLWVSELVGESTECGTAIIGNKNQILKFSIESMQRGGDKYFKFR